jgi:RNA polymerase sigma factor (sigma-70 family)
MALLWAPAMTETSWATLRQLFVDRYDDLRRRLARRLGSTDLATEILHETYLRLDRGSAQLGLVHNPKAYLFRTALNVAADHHRSAEGRRLNSLEVDTLRGIADSALDPAKATEAQLSVTMLERALDELTPRRRAILIAARLEEVPHAEIAAHFGISTRMVEKELRSALLHCSQRLEIKLTSRFGRQTSETS